MGDGAVLFLVGEDAYRDVGGGAASGTSHRSIQEGGSRGYEVPRFCWPAPACSRPAGMTGLSVHCHTFCSSALYFHPCFVFSLIRLRQVGQNAGRPNPHPRFHSSAGWNPGEQAKEL